MPQFQGEEKEEGGGLGLSSGLATGGVFPQGLPGRRQEEKTTVPVPDLTPTPCLLHTPPAPTQPSALL